MTQEEKAKAYDEALETCKRVFNFNNLSYTHCEIKEKLEQIFPEFKESEDERIRKELISIVKQYERVCIKEGDTCYAIDECLAYLENQKDEEPIMDSIKFEEGYKTGYDVGKCDGYQEGYKAGIEKQKEQDKCPEYCVRSHCIGCPIYEKQKEVDWGEELEKCKKNPLYFTKNYVRFQQKPAEWSEGTKKALDEISDYLKYKGREEDADFIKHLRPTPKQEWSEFDAWVLEDAITAADLLGNGEEYKESHPHLSEAFRVAKDWLKDLPNRISLQPKQEWNEEDRKMLFKIMDYLKVDRDEHPERTRINDMLSWLINIPNRVALPNRKLSKSQMNALEQSVISYRNHCGTDPMGDIAKSAIEDLKKLM